MAIVFKKTLRRNLLDKSAAPQYHPQLLTLGQSVGIDKIAFQIKENSSLSKGDILSVITNFVECLRSNLYNGHSVNIRDFGVFSLSARTEGTETEKDCTAKKIRAVRINFRPSSSVRPDLSATRAGDALEFVDLQTYLAAQGSGNGSENGGGSVGGGDDDQEENPLG
ncbi:MAG: HU family DNA-binding protein [Bacteroides sp.]|nr:HU family DNA-binding protein [Bacteroides sp.]